MLLARLVLFSAALFRGAAALSAFCESGADSETCGSTKKLQEDTSLATPAFQATPGQSVTLIDFDGDGDLDVVRARNSRGCSGHGECGGAALAACQVNMADAPPGKGCFGGVTYIENIGDMAHPNWGGPVEWTVPGQPRTDNKDYKVGGSSIGVGDLNGDGLLDLVIGGKIEENTPYLQTFYQQVSATTPALFTELVVALNPVSGFNPGKHSYAVPQLVDLNGDGLIDIVVGTKQQAHTQSTLHLLINSGTSTSPSFNEVTSETTSPLYGVICSTGDGYYKPSFGDVDGDGDVDLVITFSSSFCFFRNEGTPTAPSYVDHTWNAAVNPYFGSILANTHVALGDLDGDLSADWLISDCFETDAEQLSGAYAAADYTIRYSRVVPSTDTVSWNAACPVSTCSLVPGACAANPSCVPYCAAGNFFSATSNACVACPRGKWRSTAGATSEGSCRDALPCWRGNFNAVTGATTPSRSVHCVACEEGTFATATGQTECEACGAGTFGTVTGKSTEVEACGGVCSAGKFGTATGKTSEAEACGSTCGTAIVAGKYATATGQSSEAKACIDTATACDAVTVAGRYATATGQSSSALACSGVACGTATVAGRYATATGQTSSILACTGVACDAATVAGRYASATGQTSEAKACAGVACPAARYGSTAGQTSAATGCLGVCGAATVPGRYATATGQTSEANACVGTACPKGKYASINATGRSSEADACDNECAKGRYGASLAATAVAQCTDCAKGKFGTAATGRSTEADACNNNCTKGKYGNVTGQTSEAKACGSSCGAGKFGTATGTTSEAKACGGACGLGKFGTLAGKTSEIEACQHCASGGYASTPGSTACITCPIGTINTHEERTSETIACNATCAILIPGSHLNSNRSGVATSDACIPCGPGRYINSIATTCSDCPTGKYSALFSRTSVDDCTACPVAHSSRAGSTRLCDCEVAGANQLCHAGQSVIDSETCAPCAAGSFSVTGAVSACTLCSLGFYSPGPSVSLGASACTACEPGRVSLSSLQPGAIRCTACSAGSVPGPLAATCSVCAAGKFRSPPLNATCEPCAAQSVAVAGSDVCVLCGQGKIPDLSQSACIECADGTFKIWCGADATTCSAAEKKGKYNATVACRKCPTTSAKSGIICAKGLRNLFEGVWIDPNKEFNEASQVKRCFNSVACRVTQNKKGGQNLVCNKDGGYHGPLCGACDRERNFMRVASICEKCYESAITWTVSVTIAVVVVALLVLLVAEKNFDVVDNDFSTTAVKMLFSHIQLLGVLGIFKARGTDTFNKIANRPSEIVGGSLTSLLPIKCALNSQSYGQFFLNMSMPVVLSLIVLITLFPMIFIQRKERKQRRIRGTSPPVWKPRFGVPRFAAFCSCLRQPMTVYDKRAWRAPFDAPARFSAVLAFILFSLYPTLVSSIAAMLNCSDPIGGDRYLLADFTVKCYDTKHLLVLSAAATFGVVYAICIPIAIGFVVAFKSPFACRENRHTLERDIEREARDRHEASIRGLDGVRIDENMEEENMMEEERKAETVVNPFKRKTETGRRIRIDGGEVEMTKLATSTPSGDPEAGDEETEEEEEAKKGQCKIKWRFRRRDVASYQSRGIRTRFGFLFHGYATNRSAIVVSWESLVMLQKLMVTLAGSTISDPYLQILSALLILIISFALLAWVKPYRTSGLNVTAILSVFVLILTQIISIGYFYIESVDDDGLFLPRETMEICVTVLLFCTNIAALIAFFSVFVALVIETLDWCRMRRWKSGRMFEIKTVDNPSSIVVTSDALGQPRALWANPTGVDLVATRDAPQRIASLEGEVAWLWPNAGIAGLNASGEDDFAIAIAVRALPELLVLVDDESSLKTGTEYVYVSRCSERGARDITRASSMQGGGDRAGSSSLQSRRSIFRVPRRMKDVFRISKRFTVFDDVGGVSCCCKSMLRGTTSTQLDDEAARSLAAAAAAATTTDEPQDEYANLAAAALALVRGGIDAEKEERAAFEGDATLHAFHGAALVQGGSGASSAREASPSLLCNSGPAMSLTIASRQVAIEFEPSTQRASTTVVITPDTTEVDAEEWFFGADGLHGPYRLSELQSWAEENHIDYSDDVQRGSAAGAQKCSLIDALVAAGTKRGWYYDDADETTTHGPYAIEQLREWLAEDHFDGDRTCRCGRDGQDLPMAEAVAVQHEVLVV